ncbi:hypothetical protein [Priestia megaterium]|uniref:hypothetical protein n=1 Tax=Priestia megaterium TaxID=1404 RepID=UPI000BFE8340|nr:hypothetical protein [Priestia megaterium]PGQ88232.1 hypothetical protein COA18_04715 [Priestia megaterium]
MDLIKAALPKLITINEYHVEDFRKDLITDYFRVCSWRNEIPIPTDSDLVDMLEDYCHRAASLAMYCDSEFYRTLIKDDEQEDFYAFAGSEYSVHFHSDVRRMGRSQHLFILANDDESHINIPVSEVW